MGLCTLCCVQLHVQAEELQSREEEKQLKCGEQVARLQQAFALCERATRHAEKEKLSANSCRMLNERLTMLRANLDNAEHVNNTVSYDKVPPVAALAKIEARQLVQPSKPGEASGFGTPAVRYSPPAVERAERAERVKRGG